MKKGSLQLSINAIVILILAITMLGLGLGFMRNVFKEATEQFTDVGGEVQKQMIEQMKESDSIVNLNRPKLEIKRADKVQNFIGFRNVQSADRFFVITPLLPGLGQTRMTSLGYSSEDCSATPKPSCCYLTVEYKQTETQVNPGEVTVVPLNVKVDSNADEGTCFMDIEVCGDSTTFGASPPTDCSTVLTAEEKHVELTIDIKI